MADSDLAALEDLTIASFAPRVGEPFTLEAGVENGQLTLVECVSLGQSLRREGFSLRFLGPTEPVLEQRIHRLRNSVLGPMEIFLVPIGAEADGTRYEATFT